MAPDVVAIAIEAYRNERERLAKEAAKQNRDATRDLASVERKIGAVVAAIEDGGDPKTLTRRLNELAAERRELESRLPQGEHTYSPYTREQPKCMQTLSGKSIWLLVRAKARIAKQWRTSENSSSE
jgi:hypothetical protein